VAQALLTAQSLFCERDDRILFDQLELTVSEGEIWQVEGPNGSGKTTLLRILCGLSSHYEGELSWRGESMDEVREQFLSELLYIGHQAGVSAMLTAEENLHWQCALHPSLDASRAQQALESVGLKGFEDVPAHQLSAGQKRRIALAKLYMSRAKLWILDEPFTAIDKIGVAAKEVLMVEHIKAGGSVIMTTHQDLSAEIPLHTINVEHFASTQREWAE